MSEPTAAQRAVLAAVDVERTHVRSDTYAAHRCACRHLIYPCQEPGGKCLFCDCTSHLPKGAET